jgi:hypothetical protein
MLDLQNDGKGKSYENEVYKDPSNSVRNLSRQGQREWHKTFRDMHQNIQVMFDDIEGEIAKIVEKINDTTHETKQLVLIKDLIDELNMIREVQNKQVTVIEEFANILYPKSPQGGHNIGSLVHLPADVQESKHDMQRVVHDGKRQVEKIIELSKRAKDPLEAVTKHFPSIRFHILIFGRSKTFLT